MRGYAILFFACSCVFGAPSTKDIFLNKIIGGRLANIKDYRYQVLLYTNGRQICGGSIISNSFIVTAAHCTAPFDSTRFSIRAGSSNNQVGGVVIPISEVYIHENYAANQQDYDISLLKVAKKLQFGSRIAPIALPEKDARVQEGELGVTTGWGWTGRKYPNTLRVLEVPIVNAQRCGELYKPVPITERMICAGGQTGKDSCVGDSGGPLVVNGLLVGIVSFGLECATPGVPGVYSNVANMRDFILRYARI